MQLSFLIFNSQFSIYEEVYILFFLFAYGPYVRLQQ